MEVFSLLKEVYFGVFYILFSLFFLKNHLISTSFSSSAFRSVSAALSRFKVCRLSGRVWLLWASATQQRRWWYPLHALWQSFNVCLLSCVLSCVVCVVSVSSRSWSLRQASSRSGSLKGWSPAVLLQLSYPCGKTWQRWIWVTTASASLTDPWWVTPINAKHSINFAQAKEKKIETHLFCVLGKKFRLLMNAFFVWL